MSAWSCRVIRGLVVLAAALAVACGSGSSGMAALPPITVFAAASLQPAFDKIARQMNEGATFNYAGSQTLTAQLTQGAQADVFASADTAHMKTVQDAGLVKDGPQVFAHNRLEIAVAKGNPRAIRGLSDLGRSGLVVVLADPSVPAGKYAQQALAKAGVTVKPASLELQVTAVLTKVALGEADAGIVYVSDVRTSGKVDGVAIPDPYNVVANYPIAILKHAQDSNAAFAFEALVLSPTGQSILVAEGFEGA